MNLNINMNANTMKNIALAGLSLLSVGTLGYAVHVSKKASDMVSKCENTVNRFGGKIGDATDKLSDEIASHIHDSMIEESVNKAVKQKADTEVKRQAEMACNSCIKHWNAKIDNTVESTWKEMQKDLTKDLLKRVGDIDPSEVKEEAVAAARDKMLVGINEATLEAINKIRRTYEGRIAPTVNGYQSNVFFNASNTTDVAVKAILAVALKASSDYYKIDYAEKIVDLVKENDEGYLYALKALQEIGDSMTNSYYRGQITEKIIELSKES